MPYVPESPPDLQHAPESPDYLIQPHQISLQRLETQQFFHENRAYVTAFVRKAQEIGSWKIPFGPGHPNTPNRASPFNELTRCTDRHTIATHKFVCLLYLVAPSI